jgi:hypothetical protein
VASRQPLIPDEDPDEIKKELAEHMREAREAGFEIPRSPSKNDEDPFRLREKKHAVRRKHRQEDRSRVSNPPAVARRRPTRSMACCRSAVTA